MKIPRKLSALFRRGKLDAEMSEEMRHHVELQTELNVKAGMNSDEASYAALRQFGNVASVQEQARERRGWMWLEQFFQDMRYAIRGLLKSRSFTAVAMLTLALGMGSAAAIFSVTDWILFRTTKFPDDVFLIGGQNDNIPSMPYRWDYMARVYEEQNQILADFSKAALLTGNIVLDGEPVATEWNAVSVNFFSILGITPSLGRGFLPGENVEGSDRVVVVSHKFWQSRLGSRADALGQKITVDGAICIVVGVLREAQTLPAFSPNDIFRPLTYEVNPDQPWLPYLYLLGRLRPDVTREQAQQVLQGVKVEVPPTAQPYYFNDRPVLSSLIEVNRYYRPEIYWMILGAVGFLYAIACLNASNLMVVRALGRRRELSIRLALGGGRWRIIRLLAVESVTLAVIASLAGLLLANWIFPLLLNAGGNFAVTPSWASWTLGGRAIGVLALLTVLTSLLIVAIPSFHILRSDIYAGLKDGGSALGESPALARLRGGLVVLQAAFAIILLAGAVLMIQSIHRLQKVDLGFDPTGRLKVQLGFPPDYPSDPEPRLARLREVQAELMRVPGVRAVGFGMDVLLPGSYIPTYIIERPGRQPIKAACMGFGIGYQDASGLILKRGHWLNQRTGGEVLVNESFARACWPGEEPVGKLVRPVDGSPAHGPEWTGWVVAGVIGDVRSTVRDLPGNCFFGPEGWGPSDFNTFIVRLAGNTSEATASRIRRQLYAFDSRITVNDVRPVSELRGTQLWAERLADSVLRVLAGVALVLTVVGMFSVLAYTVDRRMGEFGVRVALGATRSDLVRLVMRRGVRLTIAGIVLGLGGAVILTRYLQSLLFEISGQDPRVLALVGAILLLMSIFACLLPALRASKVDPMVALRAE